jgi:phage/plasmid-associated DNA primase
MYLVLETQIEGLLFLYNNIDKCGLTFMKRNRNGYTKIIYKITEEQLSQITTKPYINFKICKDKFNCIISENIDTLLKPNKINKIICNNKVQELPEIFFNEFSTNKVRYLSTDEIITKIINEFCLSHGIIAQLYYSIYGNTYIYDENQCEKNQSWFVLNKYGIYDVYGDSLPPARKNIPEYVGKLIDDKLKEKIKNLRKLAIAFGDQAAMDQRKEELKNLCSLKNKISKFVNTKCNIPGIFEFLKNYYGKTNIYEKIDKVSKYAIAFNNGVYDIKNKEFRKGKAEELITCTTGYNYFEPKQHHYDFINKLLEEFIPNEDERIYALKKISLILIDGNPLQEFYVIVGAGSNGKGKFMELIQLMLGKYCGNMTPDYFDKSIPNKDADKPCETISKNKNSRVVFIDEIEHSFEISGSKIRRITGGTILKSRSLYGHVFDYVAGYIPIFISNYELSFDMSAEHGIRRYDEWKIFRNQFVDNPDPNKSYQKKKDRNLTEKLESDIGYRLAFFHILLKYYYEFTEVDNMTILRPKLMQEERDEIIQENDPIGNFMNEYIEQTNTYEDKITGSELFTAFINYNRGGSMKFQRPQFYQILKNKHFIVKDFCKQKVVRGIKNKKPFPNKNNEIQGDIDFIDEN